MIYNTIIVGSGPAGVTASLYLARAGLDVMIIEKGATGGKVFLTHKIDNYPGFATINGREFAKEMTNQAKALGVVYEYGDVLEIEAGDVKKVTTNMGTYEAYNIIIATGCENSHLGIEGEEQFSGRGVSYCAICDGGFFKGKDVVVIGGGNSAVEESSFLLDICNSVSIVHRRDEFRADKFAVDKLKEADKVKFFMNHTPLRIIGEEVVTGIEVQNNETKAISVIPTSGVFIYVGLKPQTEFIAKLGITNERGYIIVNDKMQTSQPGIYGAGDAIDKHLRQIVTATNDGAIAAQNIVNQS